MHILFRNMNTNSRKATGNRSMGRGKENFLLIRKKKSLEDIQWDITQP